MSTSRSYIILCPWQETTAASRTSDPRRSNEPEEAGVAVSRRATGSDNVGRGGGAYWGFELFMRPLLPP